MGLSVCEHAHEVVGGSVLDLGTHHCPNLPLTQNYFCVTGSEQCREHCCGPCNRESLCMAVSQHHR